MENSLSESDIVILNGQTEEERKQELEKLFSDKHLIECMNPRFKDREDESDRDPEKVHARRLEAVKVFFGDPQRTGDE